VKTIFKANKAFFIPYAFFLVIGTILIIVNTKAETHLEFNSFHNSFADVIFYYATNLGNGYAAVFLGILLLFIRYRWVIILALSTIISGIITQVLKHTLFSDIVRPKKFFEGVHELYLLPNVDNHLYNSFPSGHTTCAFALYLSIALCVKNRGIKLLCFLLAIAASYSRIYLSQHFLEDVYAGSLIGTITALFVFIFMQKRPAAWLNRSLIGNNRLSGL